jgi:hypothetical protein
MVDFGSECVKMGLLQLGSEGVEYIVAFSELCGMLVFPKLRVVLNLVTSNPPGIMQCMY